MQWKTWYVILRLEAVEISGKVPAYPRRAPSRELYGVLIQEGKIKVSPYSIFKLLIT